MPTPLLPLLLAAAPALAGDAPTLALVGIHHEPLDEAAQQAAAAKVARAVDRGGFEALTPHEVAALMRGREAIVLRDAFLGRGRTLLDNGQSLYNQAEFGAAVPVLEDAVDTLRHGVATANSARSLWEAWTLLGTVHLMRDDAPRAREAYAHAVTLNPTRVPSAAQYPPNVLATYAQARDHQLASPATLEVTADAPDVTVWINGVEKGPAPLVVDVVAGENHVVAKGADGSHAYARVEVEPGGSRALPVHMAAPNLGLQATSRAARARQTANLYRSFGEHADIDLILLAGVADDSVFLQLYSPRADAFSTPVEAEWSGRDPTDAVVSRIPEILGRVRSDGTFLSTQIASQAVPLDVGSNQLLARMLLDPAPADTLTPTSRKGTRAWTIAAVGLGGAALATGAVIALTTEKAPRFQGRIEVVLP